VQDAYRNNGDGGVRDVFPAGRRLGRKEGTMTNSERCVSRVRAAVRLRRSPPRLRIAVRIFTKTFSSREEKRFVELRKNLRNLNEDRETTRGRDLEHRLSKPLLDERGPAAVRFPRERPGRKKAALRGRVFPTASGGARASSRRPTGRSRRRWMRATRWVLPPGGCAISGTR